ncbi:universal stress protein [Nocardia asteroides]|uniref:universal stress protein n=1 Tax=Nocardia asteroides TaxID=1824 RepID=UPI001E61AF51|nr:universal stress protein [Nocardia asteroides]UGT63201.1 universal stress protein [Nocardia asteroides]
MQVAQQSIVVGIDGTAPALAAARWAAALAAGRGAPLILVSVIAVPDTRIVAPRWADADLRDLLRAEGRRAVRQAAAVVQADRPGVEPTQLVLDGDPAAELLVAAESARLLVVAAGGASPLRTLLLGSTALRVADKALCPVAVWRGDPDAPLPGRGPVLAGVDGSPCGDIALEHAFDLASLLGTDLVALHAWNDPDLLRWSAAPEDERALAERETELLGERLAGWPEKYPDVAVTRVVRKSPAASALLAEAETASLVVAGTHGRNRLVRTMIGSTSQNLLHHAPCPVVLCRLPA